MSMHREPRPEPRSDESLRDPLNGYASADLMDPNGGMDRARDVEDVSPDLRDPMNGYASADLVDPDAAPNRHQPPGDEQSRDPFSGYASGDVMDEEPPIAPNA